MIQFGSTAPPEPPPGPPGDAPRARRGEPAHPGLITRALWTLAGADVETLCRPECATERVKYSVFGTSVVSTMVLAGVSGTFALEMVMPGDPWAAVVGGGVWAALIGVAEVSTLVTLRKAASGGMLPLLMRAAPRLALAAAVSLSVGEPLKWWLLEGELNAEVAAGQRRERDAANAELRDLYPAIPRLEAHIASLNARLAAAEADARAKRNAVDVEVDRGNGSGRRDGYGPIAKFKQQSADAAAAASARLVATLRPEIDRSNAELARVRAQQDAERKEAETGIGKAEGILARHAALTRLGRHAEFGPQVRAMDRLLLALLFLAETLPLLSKLGAARGPHDALLDLRQSTIMARADARRGIADAEAHAIATDAFLRRADARRSMQGAFARVLDEMARTETMRTALTALARQLPHQVRHRLRRQFQRLFPEDAGGADRAPERPPRAD